MNFSYLVEQQRAFFFTHQSKALAFRQEQLGRLEKMIKENEEAICSALSGDLGKPVFEGWTAEIAVTLEELALTQKNLSAWMKDLKVKTPLHLMPGKSLVHFEPLGVVLILAPWNYPFQLAIAPLIGALAAGNCAIIKPSELTPLTSALIKKLVSTYFEPHIVSVVEGGIPETSALLKEKFDHIFFTGSAGVGKIVMAAAVQNLTPVTLELGGKSPVIVTKNADIQLAAKKITWGKFLNAGQTCVAPDYVYVHESIEKEFVAAIHACLKTFFSEDPFQSTDFGRIVNVRNVERLQRLIPKDHVILGGDVRVEEKYISPTLIQGCSWQDAVMKEEIFGPLLPIFTFEHWSEVEEKVLAGDKPLAAYLFSGHPGDHQKFLERLSFGGGCINDVIVHLAHPHLPFGGVGMSGMGAYHGEASFRLFSHAKSILKMSTWFDLPFRYPPYKMEWLKWAKRYLG